MMVIVATMPSGKWQDAPKNPQNMPENVNHNYAILKDHWLSEGDVVGV